MSVTATAVAPATSIPAARDGEREAVFVLHGRALRAGAELEHTSRHHDDVWYLDAAIHQQHQRRITLRFADLPARYRAVAKQLCYALLSGPLPYGEARPAIGTVRNMFVDIKRFLDWMEGRPSPPRLAEVTMEDLEHYQRHLLGVAHAATTRSRARSGVRLFWRYRHALTDHLGFDPRRIDGWDETRSPAVENVTDRVPEAVCGPLLAWALRFVDDFAPDILAVNRQWQHMHAPRVRRTRAERHRLLRELLDAHLAQRRPLPGYSGQPSLAVIAAMINDYRLYLLEHRAEVEAVAAVVGVRQFNAYEHQITGQLDGMPWIGAIATVHRGNNYGLACLARMLQAACYIVIAYLSGMRDSEIKHLRRGCLRVERDPDGVPYRWTVASLAFKGETDPTGVPATWVVGAPAARAIAALEQLQHSTVDLLFTPLPHSPSAVRAGRTNAAAVTSTTNRQLREFISWVNTYCAEHGRADAVPPVNGKPWRIKTSQFRRTLAWFIARRPGGTIAGAIAYRHLSIQMFEGYAGTSESGFRAEVESEQALARGEHLLAMTDAHEHDTLAGPAADEASKRLADFAHRARFQGIVITDPRRLTRLMQRDDPAVYPGTYVTCIYDHAKALCRQDRSGADRPDLGTCRPLHCGNVALTGDNAAAWQAEIDRINARLTSRPTLPPLLHQQTLSRRDQIADFLSRHQPDPP